VPFVDSYVVRVLLGYVDALCCGHAQQIEAELFRVALIDFTQPALALGELRRVLINRDCLATNSRTHAPPRKAGLPCQS